MSSGSPGLNFTPFTLSLEPSGLHSISAQLHVAPPPGVVFAGVQEQPAALRVVASPHAIDGFRRHQIRCAHAPAPKAAASASCSFWGHSHSRRGDCFQFSFCARRAARKYRSSVLRAAAGGWRPSSLRRRFRPAPRGTPCNTPAPARPFTSLAACAQPASLGGSQQFRLFGESHKIVVALHQFLGSALPESPVQSVDKIQRRDDRPPIECPCSFLDNPLIYLDRLPIEP